MFDAHPECGSCGCTNSQGETVKRPVVGMGEIIMAGQASPPGHVPPPRNKGLHKVLLRDTNGFS